MNANTNTNIDTDANLNTNTNTNIDANDNLGLNINENNEDYDDMPPLEPIQSENDNLFTTIFQQYLGNSYEELSRLDENLEKSGCDINEKSEIVELEENEDCCICYDSFNKMNKLKCNHLFCNECLDEWLKRK